ncbi:Hypothetical predicted protein [Mytilus galloprovincialis]|uniref:Uncharacterized protein n=1 Tax=Mytilus galloprovincialis TaxID=29158 RepID=A0A8B6GNP5_MYTGA|nr:Hypothetical predicted protein [Mytilus galloprovincialis]
MCSQLIVEIIQFSIVLLTFVAVNCVPKNNTDALCKVAFEDEKDGQSRVNTSAKLLHITLDFQNTTTMLVLQDTITLYNPHEWIITSGTYGSGLLQLRSIYEILSLKSLSVHTRRNNIKLTQFPHDCLQGMNASEFELIIRMFLLQHIGTNEEVCNIHIRDDYGFAEFDHECCSLGADTVECYVVRKNLPMKMIDICSYIVVVLVILYCPLLIPSSLYKRKLEFVHRLAEPLRIRCKKTGTDLTWRQNGLRRLVYLARFVKNKPEEDEDKIVSEYTFGKYFQSTLEKMSRNGFYEIVISQLHFKVKHREIISESKIETGLLHICYNLFIKCGRRKKYDRNIWIKKNPYNCCYRNVLGCFKPFGKEYPWYKCLRVFMHIVLAAVVCSPWVFRICVYYLYEYSLRNERLKAAEKRNLKLRLHENLMFYLTPIHVLFIACYVILALEWISFRFMSKNVKYLTKEMLQICFHGMNDSAKMKKVFLWAINTLSIPIKSCGIFGFFLGVIFWPITLPYVVIVVCYHIFPTIRLCVSLFWIIVFDTIPDFRSCSVSIKQHRFPLLTFFTDPIQNTFDIGYIEYRKSRGKIIRFVQILFSILAVCSIGLITVECVVFLIDVAVYTMIGLILNSSHAMQLVSAFSIAWFYFQKCFEGNSGIYLKYTKVILRILQNENKDELQLVADLDSTHQTNTAFLVKHAKCNAEFFVNNNGKPMLTTKGVVLLLDKYDNLYIERAFFRKACQIDHPSCPGPVHEQIMKSFRRFMSIVMFLIFVTLIVLAFGDTYSISISNQLLATIAGGFVPWVLMKSDILFKNPVEPDFDQLSENICFQSRLKEKINNDEETWRISDMEVESIREIQATEKIDLIVKLPQSGMQTAL